MQSTTDAQLVPASALPAPQPPVARGGGLIIAQRVEGLSAVVTSGASSPLKLLVPKPRGRCVWAFASTFGGGMLAGDQVDLKLTVDDGANLLLGTQASTKIYRSGLREGDKPSPATQRIAATVAAGASLLLLPDPVQPFADSNYEQRQRVDLSSTGSLVLLDWLTSGRLARGERWAMTRYLSRNEIFVDGRRIATDTLLLDDAFGDPIDAMHRMGRFDCFATLMLVGPRVVDGAKIILDELNNTPAPRRCSLLATASPLGDSGAIVRVLGASSQDVSAFLRERLTFVWEISGEDPWNRKM